MSEKAVETTPAPHNIYQKLIAVRKSVPYLEKANVGYQFKYVSSSQTLGALRKAMDEEGLLLVPKITDIVVKDHTTAKDKHEYFTALTMEFTWINADKPEETIVCPWYGQGLDDGEKGVGKALTYAEKFFMLKFFNIATDKDDPDSFQKKHDENGNGNGKEGGGVETVTSPPYIPKKKEEPATPPANTATATPPAQSPAPTGNAETRNFIPSDVRILTGTKKDTGKPWTKYVIKGPDGDYSTFSESLAGEAKKAKESGALIGLTYTTNKFGNEVVSIGPALYFPDDDFIPEFEEVAS